MSVSTRPKPKVHPIDEAWLALGTEPAIGPQIDIVDSHFHLWDFSDPAYFAEDYRRDAAPVGISAAVFAECTMAYGKDGPFAPVGEVEFAAAQAEAVSGEIDIGAAIVGWADLTLGDVVGDVLDALDAAGRGRFRGIRTRATYDPDPVAGYGDNGVGPHLLLQDDYRRGVEQLNARGHVLDLYAFHTQLAEVADLAKSFPDLPIVLNHIGGPLGVAAYAQARNRVWTDWQEGMEQVANCANVSVKVGGFAISRVAIVATGGDRPLASQQIADLCRPWVDHCLAAFGADRCIFGSNFPVDKVAMPLGTLINAMKLLTADLGADGQAEVFAGNARRVYRL